MTFKVVQLGVDSGQMSVFFGKPTKEDAYVDSIATVPAKAGTYTVWTVEESHEGRVGKLVIVREDDPHHEESFAHITVPEDCEMVIGDPCYYLGGEYADESMGYGKACNANNEKEGGTFELNGAKGFCCSSGYGDGEYTASIETDKHGNLVRASVVFVDEDEDGECEDEDYDEDESENDEEDENERA